MGPYSVAGAAAGAASSTGAGGGGGALSFTTGTKARKSLNALESLSSLPTMVFSRIVLLGTPGFCRLAASSSVMSWMTALMSLSVPLWLSSSRAALTALKSDLS